MKKKPVLFIIPFIFLFLILAYFVYRFSFKNTVGNNSYLSVFLKSNIEKYNVSEASNLQLLISDFKIAENGILDRSVVATQTIVPTKKIINKIVIELDHGEYPNDRVVSNDVLISSTQDTISGSGQLTLKIGFDRNTILNLDEEKVLMIINNAIISSLYRISHYNSNFDMREAELKNLLAESIKNKMYVINLD